MSTPLSPVKASILQSPSKSGTAAMPLSSIKQPIVIPPSPVKTTFTPSSPDKSSFNPASLGRSASQETYLDNSNDPTTNISTLKRNKYGPALTAGRRLGRHLPRIASGDAGDDWGDPHPPKPTAEESAREKREREREERRKELEEKGERDREARQRRRTLQGLNTEDDLAFAMAPPLSASAALPPPSAAPVGAEDVAGIPGRLRFTRDATPLPSSRLGGNWADSQRKHLQAYEYLCHVGEAQQWIEGCLGYELGFGVVEMDEELRNGVALAKLARIIGEGGEGEVVRKIFE
ncbi:hypothetical protein FRC12_022721, partial [Ceratobasidium sp. 428]